MDYGLHPATDTRPRVSFCGPAAIAAATGIDVVKVEDAVLAHRRERGKPRIERKMRGARVKTMWSSEIEPVLRRLGFTAAHYPIVPRTFKQLSDVMQTGKLRGPVITLVTGHYVALSRWTYVDSNRREPTPHAKYGRQRQKVKHLWTINPAA
jgi:hypothetical protein